MRPLVAGTQIGYSPAHVQAGLDYVDAHSYWQHPAFPGRPWDSRDWYVRNVGPGQQARRDALPAWPPRGWRESRTP